MKTADLTSVEKLTRDQVVPFYRKLILDEDNDDEASRINRLILSKWKVSGLEYIKDVAWKNQQKPF